jgi:uncharacterized damage-inducible protein DinB
VQKNYRKGGLGALQDEYDRASIDLFDLLERMNDQEYMKERPQERETINSIQKIMRHVVRSAYGYTNNIRKTIGVPVTAEKPEEDFDRRNVISALHEVLRYSSDTFDGKWLMSDESLDSITMKTPWNVEYTIEQLMEHAIVHILRHRRQIERLLRES